VLIGVSDDPSAGIAVVNSYCDGPCGVLLLGPHVTYPPHRHEADEIYVPLAGTAAWKHGNEGWRERLPGSVIHHAPYVPHAMQTGQEPLLALYLWRSEDLAQQSRLDPAPGPG